ncbi:MAG TPA: CAAX prenyl protease-related protein [Verrucomicrobiae bacterium]|nr:CAAX prenyl protease-related protein [Verrucomicrobiae bacterium]
MAPFVVFVLLTALQGHWGEASRYWLYLIKTAVGIGLIWLMRPVVTEMRWAFSWEAVVVGVAVFAIWVGLDGHYPSFDQIIQNYLCPALKSAGLEKWCPQPAANKLPWNPNAQFGPGTPLAMLFIITRILGSSLVVPPLEEVFYRSFLYRYIVKPDFLAVSFGTFHAFAFVVTAAIFGFSHYEWLAGILCGFAYQGLVLWKKRLGDAMTAHAITNFLLGVWIVWRGAWHFW